jgi:predicted RNA-binding Zn ribbon-like protein
MSALSASAMPSASSIAATDSRDSRVRERKCGLLFTDTSRPRSRLWCSGERCGSAARSAEYRRRHKK